MSIDAENTSVKNADTNAVSSQDSHSDGEHHHHHHTSESGHHHRHHHHTSEGEHHHQRHHHHRTSEDKKHRLVSASNKNRKKKRRFRGIKSTLKSFFLKHFSKNKKSETEKQKLIKRAIFLILLFSVFFTSYYFLVLNNVEDSGISFARKTSSEADILRMRLVQTQNELKALKDELAAYKAAFGELDLNSENK